MPAFRNSRRLAAAALAALLLAPAAFAQVGPPVRLSPPPGAPAEMPPPPPPPDRVLPRGSQGITVDQLAPLSPDAIGVLGSGNHGFPDSLWQGTARATVQALMPKIGSTSSPTLQDLAYRLLATSATPPGGPGEGSLLALRAERLTNALGRADTALTLLQALPPDQRGEDLAKISADLSFLSGNGNGACSQIRGHDKSWRSPYWDRGLITCQALDGSTTEAQLGLDLLREAKTKDDGFAALVELALGNDAKLPDTLPGPQPMALALLDKASQTVPKKAFDSARLPMLVEIAVGTGFPADQRATAAEKAAALGGLAPEVLAGDYLAVPLDEDDLANPLNRADAVGGTKGRAILFRAAHDATSVTAKANFLQALLLKSPRADLYPAVLRAAQSMLLEVPASIDMKPQAVDFARALYALDHPNEAGQWLAVADPQAAAAVLALAHIAAGAAAPAWTDTPLADLTGGTKKDPALGLKRATALVQLLAAEGNATPGGLVMPLLDARIGGPGSLGPGLLIDSEAAGKHLGGTVLAVLAGLGDEGAAGPSQTVAQAVAGLRKAGLPDEARHLAIDAALAAGL
jgi:hypothetical protein